MAVRDILEVLTGLTKLSDFLGERHKLQRQLTDAALQSISTALSATSLYYRDLEAGSERNLETEGKLNVFWGNAAIPMRHVDPDLARVCAEKAQYWLNPDSWSDREIREVGIALDSVQRRYIGLITSPPYRTFSSLRLRQPKH
jgi:hypothetical protein